MTEFRLAPLGENLYLIDAWMEDQPERLACYLFDTPERVLVEVGPSSTLDHLLAALDSLGIDDLAALVVTHIHVDHAGGAGHFARRFPNTRIGVHTSGARHLIDPTRLWASAARIYGEEELAGMWGRMEPLAEDRILALGDGDRLALGGGRSLEVMHTPGHAKHHLVFTEERSGAMFVGDAVGLCYPHGHFVQPASPPPDFDPALISHQLQRMAERSPDFLGFAHFGPTYEVGKALADAEERLWGWVRLVESLDRIEDGAAAQRLRRWTADLFRAEGHRREDIAYYDARTHWPMQVAGIRRWLSLRNGAEGPSR